MSTVQWQCRLASRPHTVCVVCRAKRWRAQSASRCRRGSRRSRRHSRSRSSRRSSSRRPAPHQTSSAGAVSPSLTWRTSTGMRWRSWLSRWAAPVSWCCCQVSSSTQQLPSVHTMLRTAALVSQHVESDCCALFSMASPLVTDSGLLEDTFCPGSLGSPVIQICSSKPTPVTLRRRTGSSRRRRGTRSGSAAGSTGP